MSVPWASQEGAALQAAGEQRCGWVTRPSGRARPAAGRRGCRRSATHDEEGQPIRGWVAGAAPGQGFPLCSGHHDAYENACRNGDAHRHAHICRRGGTWGGGAGGGGQLRCCKLLHRVACSWVGGSCDAGRRLHAPGLMVERPVIAGGARMGRHPTHSGDIAWPPAAAHASEYASRCGRSPLGTAGPLLPPGPPGPKHCPGSPVWAACCWQRPVPQARCPYLLSRCRWHASARPWRKFKAWGRDCVSVLWAGGA